MTKKTKQKITGFIFPVTLKPVDKKPFKPAY